MLQISVVSIIFLVSHSGAYKQTSKRRKTMNQELTVLAVKRDRLKCLRYLSDTRKYGMEVWQKSGVRKTPPNRSVFIPLTKGFKIYNLTKRNAGEQEHAPGVRYKVYRSGPRNYKFLCQEALKHPAFPPVAFEEAIIDKHLDEWKTTVYQRRGIALPHAAAMPSWVRVLASSASFLCTTMMY